MGVPYLRLKGVRLGATSIFGQILVRRRDGSVGLAAHEERSGTPACFSEDPLEGSGFASVSAETLGPSRKAIAEAAQCLENPGDRGMAPDMTYRSLL
jgi:hypothetical protein